MPHSLLELNAMSEEQLRSIAESLEIKGAKKLDRAALGFAILDKQAVMESQKPAEPKAPKAAAQKKRGRPKKEETKKEEAKADEPKAEAPKQEAPAPEAAAAPKKRGRKAKAQQPQEQQQETAAAPAPAASAKEEPAAAVKPAASSNVAIAQRFVPLNGSGIVWERATWIGRVRTASSAAVIAMPSRVSTVVPSNGIAVKVS